MFPRYLPAVFEAATGAKDASLGSMDAAMKELLGHLSAVGKSLDDKEPIAEIISTYEQLMPPQPAAPPVFPEPVAPAPVVQPPPLAVVPEPVAPPPVAAPPSSSTTAADLKALQEQLEALKAQAAAMQ